MSESVSEPNGVTPINEKNSNEMSCAQSLSHSCVESADRKRFKDRTKKESVMVIKSAQTFSRKTCSRKNKNPKKMVDTRNQKESRGNAERRFSSENRSAITPQPIKEEVLSDDHNSVVSDVTSPVLVTRSRVRRLERRKAYSSHSSAMESDNRKTKSEPIIITLDSDSDDNVSAISGRPNRTARIKGELIRKLSGTTTKVSNYHQSKAACDSSSSSDYGSVKKRKKSKHKPKKASSSHSAKRKKYLVNKLKCQSRIKVRKHGKRHVSHVFRPRRDLRSFHSRFEDKKKSLQNKSHVSSHKKSHQSTVSTEKRSLRSTSTETAVETITKSEIEPVCKTKTEPEEKTETEPKDKIEIEPKDKNEMEPKGKIEMEPKNKIEMEPKNKIEMEPKNKIEIEPKNKIEIEPKGKIEIELKDKIEMIPNDKTEIDTEDKIEVEPEHIELKIPAEPHSDDVKTESAVENIIKCVEKDIEDNTISADSAENPVEDKNMKSDTEDVNMETKETDSSESKTVENNTSKEGLNNSLKKTSVPIIQPPTKVRKIKKKAKPVDKIIRKRGRPRLSDLKPVTEMPVVNDIVQIPFLQSTFCFVVAPKLPKCRECRIAVNRTNRSMLNAYCRFMEYRKLCYNKNGVILNAGFSEPSEATIEHLNQWLPQLDDPPKDLNCNTSKSLVEHIGDQFCDLVEQEKEALSLHIGKNRIITWKRIVQGVREMCDVCYTTIFNIHWVCPICGLAVCIDCYKCRKQGIQVEYEDGQPKSRDQYNWLLCTTLRQPHDPGKLVMAQIIPGNALWTMRDLLHKARIKWNIPSYCRCNSQDATTQDKYMSTGICKQLMSFVTKSFSMERSNLYYNTDSSIHNGDNSYDDLDIEVTGSALKWLEGAASSNNIENLKPADDYFNCFEDFSSLRGNLLNGIPDEDVSPDSEREFLSFSLDDIIECMSKSTNADNRENSGKTVVKHFSCRYPQANSGREPLPIRIYTKLESNLAFSSVPHSWFCNGRLLFLHKADHKDNLALFQEQWKRGQPILVKGVEERLNIDLWHPDAFCRDFGEVKNDLVDCKTGFILKNFPMKKFWEGFESFEKRLTDDNGEYRLLKLKDWPPGEDFSEMLPKRFHDLMKGLPLPEYTHRDGILNLAGRLPSWFVRPDLGPKMYNAYGSALYPSKGTTNLHLDVSDAVNVMVYVGIPSDGNAQLHIEEALKAIDEGGCDSLMRARVRARGAKPGALWHIYNARDSDKIRDLLAKVAIERGEKLEAHHDPIHDQSWYLDAELRKRLYRDYGVEGYAIAQCLGDAVFIPAGAPHQVRNLHSCVKVAEDFVSPENIAHCFKLTQEFRHLSDTHTNHEDKLQIKNIIYHVVRDALAHLLSDGDSLES